MAKIKNTWWAKLLSSCFLTLFITAIGVGFMGIREGKSIAGIDLALNGQAIYPQSVGQEVPEIYGTKVVWMQQGSDFYYKVFLGDLETGTTRQLGQSTAAEKYPAIWKDKVIWMDYRSIMDDPTVENKYAYIFKYYDMYGCNLEGDQEFPICTNTEWQGYGDVQEDRVVYADMRNGNPDIFLYDMITNQEYAICMNPAWQGNPIIYDDYAVWMDERSGNYDIYGRNLATGQEVAICTAPDNQAYPAMSGTKVVWQDKRNGNDDIYMYNLVTNTETPICVHDGKQQVPDICGNIVVWQDDRNGNWDIYGYNIITGEEFQITDKEGDETFPAISGDRIVWVDSENGNKNVFAAVLPANFAPILVLNRNLVSATSALTTTGAIDTTINPISIKPVLTTVGTVEVANNSASIIGYENGKCNNGASGDGTSTDVRASGEEKFTYSYNNNILYLLHENASYNCCIEKIIVTMEMVGNTINIYEEEWYGDNSPCKCLCPYDITTKIGCLEAGTYVVNFYNKQTGKLLGVIKGVIIPEIVCPVTFAAPNQKCCPFPCTDPVNRCCPISSTDPQQKCYICPMYCPLPVVTEPVQVCCPCSFYDNMEQDTWTFTQGAITNLLQPPPPIQKIDYSTAQYVSPKRSVWAYLASYLEKTTTTSTSTLTTNVKSTLTSTSKDILTSALTSIDNTVATPIIAIDNTVATTANARVSASRIFSLCGCENLKFEISYLIRQYMSSRSAYRKVSVEIIAYDGSAQKMGQHTYLLFRNPSQELEPDTTYITPFAWEQWNTLGRNLQEDMPIKWCEARKLKVNLKAEGYFPAGQSDFLEVFWDDLKIQGQNCNIVQPCCPVATTAPSIWCCPISNTDPKGLCCPYSSADPASYCKPCPVPAGVSPDIICKPCPVPAGVSPDVICKPCPYAQKLPTGEIRYCCPVATATTANALLWCQPCPVAQTGTTTTTYCCPLPKTTVASETLWCRPCPLATNVDSQVQMWCCPLADVTVEGNQMWCRPCPIAVNVDDNIKRWCCPIAQAEVASQAMWCRPCPYVVERDSQLTRWCCPVAQNVDNLLWCRPCPYPQATDKELTPYCCPIATSTGQDLWCRPCPLADGVDEILKQWCCPLPTVEVNSDVLWCRPCPIAYNVDGSIIQKCCPLAANVDNQLWCKPCPYSSTEPAYYCKPCPVPAGTSPDLICQPCPLSSVTVNDQALRCYPCPVLSTSPYLICYPCPVPTTPLSDNCIIGRVESIQHHASTGRSDLKVVDAAGDIHEISVPLTQAESLAVGDQVKVCVEKDENGRIISITVEKYDPQSVVIPPAQLCCPYSSADPVSYCKPFCPVSTSTTPTMICQPCPVSTSTVSDLTLRCYPCPLATAASPNMVCQPCPYAQKMPTGEIIYCCPVAQMPDTDLTLWCKPCPLASVKPTQVCCPVSTAEVAGVRLPCCPIATSSPVSWCKPYVVTGTGEVYYPYYYTQVSGCTENNSGALDIEGAQGMVGNIVTIPVRLQYAPGSISTFGFEVTYDPDVLEYSDFEPGNLVSSFEMFNVHSVGSDRLRIGGASTVAMPQGANGTVVLLKFIVKGGATEGSCYPLNLENLADDIAQFSKTGGCFCMKDTVPPEIICPAEMTIAQIDLNGTPADDPDVLAFLSEAKAWDNLDGEVKVIYYILGAISPGHTVVAKMASAGDPVPGAEIYLEQEPNDEPIAPSLASGSVSKQPGSNTYGINEEGIKSASLAVLPPGTTSVMFVSHDTGGNISSCIANITVQPIECAEDESGNLNIPGTTGKVGQEVWIPVQIQSAPNAVNAFGFEVTYKPSILEYTGFFQPGDLVASFPMFEVNSIGSGRLIVGGASIDAIPQGANGNVVLLKFMVKAGMEGSCYPLNLENLADNMAQFSATQGCFCIHSCNGDQNGDGIITPSDALAVFKCYLGSGPCGDCADVNGDGSVTPSDALCLFKAYLGQDSCLDTDYQL